MQQAAQSSSSSSDSVEAESLRAVRFRFLIGELQIAAWKPMLKVFHSNPAFQTFSPGALEYWAANIPSQAAGILLQNVPAGIAKAGIRHAGPVLVKVAGESVIHGVKVDCGFEDYLRTFSPKARQNLMRAVRRHATRQGSGTIVTVARLPNEILAFRAAALQISRQTYQHQLLQAGLPDSEAFKQGMLHAAEAQQAYGWLLYEHGQPIAFAWCRGSGQHLTYDVVGYLKEHARNSPGTVLLYYILRHLFNSGQHTTMDFGSGEAFYKSLFSNYSNRYQDVYLFKPKAVYWCILQLHRSFDAVNGIAGHWLDRWGLKSVIKRWMRRSAHPRNKLAPVPVEINQYEFRFEIGRRRLLTIKRAVVAPTLSFLDITENHHLSRTLPALTPNGLFLRSLPESELPALIDQLAEERRKGNRWLLYEVSKFPRWYIDLSGNFGDYLAKFSSKTRTTLRRKIARLTAEGQSEPEWRVYRTPQELEIFWPQALEVSRHTYQHLLLGAGLPATKGYRDQALKLAAADSVRAYLLFLRGRAIAYMFCPIKEGVVEYAYLGHLTDHAALSPGTVLQWLALSDLFAEGKFRAFDFTEGDGDHKRLFATDHVHCRNLLVLPMTWRNWMIIQLHRSFNEAVKMLKSVAVSLRLHTRARSWFR